MALDKDDILGILAPKESTGHDEGRQYLQLVHPVLEPSAVFHDSSCDLQSRLHVGGAETSAHEEFPRRRDLP